MLKNLPDFGYCMSQLTVDSCDECAESVLAYR